MGILAVTDPKRRLPLPEEDALPLPVAMTNQDPAQIDSFGVAPPKPAQEDAPEPGRQFLAPQPPPTPVVVQQQAPESTSADFQSAPTATAGKAPPIEAAPEPPPPQPPPGGVGMQTGGDLIGYTPPPGVELQVPGPGGASEFFAPTIPPGGIEMWRSDDPNQPGGAGGAAPGDIIGPGATPSPVPPPALPGAGGGATTPPPAAGAPGGPPGQSTINQSVWDRLNELLNKKFGYDPTSPENRIQLDVQRAASQRSAERRRASMAERAAQTGALDAGSFDVGVDQIAAGRGMEDAAFESQLVVDDLTRQREDLHMALQLGAGLMTADEQRKLQRELSAVDAALKREQMQIEREGLAQQGALSREDMALRRMLGLEGVGVQREGIASQERIASLDAQLRREGLSVQQLLGMGQLGNDLLGILLDQQLGNDRLGFDFAQLQALLNERAFNFAGGR